MTKTLTLLVASTALTAALGLPAWSALHAPAQEGAAASLSRLLAGDDARPLVLVDDDEGENGGAQMGRRASDGEDEEDEDTCEDDDGSCGSRSAAPAPAGSVPPPQNGLFDNSAAPQATVK